MLILSLRRILALLMLAAFLTPTLAMARAEATQVFTSHQKQRLFRVCSTVDSKQVKRCEARQLARANRSWGRSSPLEAYDLYDSLDLGKNHLRDRLQLERSTSYKISVSKERRTYSEFVPKDDINTQRLPYLNAIQQERLRCMTDVPHGRPRALCLEQAAINAREYMASDSTSYR
ncbi:MAG: hypothetical protein PHI23_05245 [Candidatus Peribacteraceae bacterium]|nr:hypothetical protein [Candidatus Peribacteraceae bacterium]